MGDILRSSASLIYFVSIPIFVAYIIYRFTNKNSTSRLFFYLVFSVFAFSLGAAYFQGFLKVDNVCQTESLTPIAYFIIPFSSPFIWFVLSLREGYGLVKNDPGKNARMLVLLVSGANAFVILGSLLLFILKSC